GVGAVARVPNEGVVAGAQQGDVVAGPAAYQVVSLAAGQHVGIRTAVFRKADDAGLEGGGVDSVIAGEAVDRELVRGLGRGDVHRGREPADLYAATDRAGDDDVVVATGAVDDDTVHCTIAAAASGGQTEVDGGHAGAH